MSGAGRGPTLRNGQRVRVQLRSGRDCPEVPHFPGEDRMVGRVIGATPTRDAPTHPYLVVFDSPLVCAVRGGQTFQLWSRQYAQDELVPLDP
jgi:hypothetical protein